ncbi:MAG TPA: X-Pro aminopeptidase, partial [Halieaceae bacterium]|nr:X-Pro aminopeptidase [Halieaceae bacterium]
AGITVQVSDCPLMSAKARKNSIEVDGARRAHLRDAVAKAQFLAWIDKTVSHGVLPTEAELADQLHQFRAANSDFIEPSFSTISAAGPNAALCHYNHRTAAAPARLAMNSLYLVDSGGQYLDGTTDVTRTVAIGEPSDEMRKHFTLVLKGHIALARICFPRGTSGMQLDPLARQYLWQHELDFEHGTGHGVGSYLSVHEGPQRIAKLGSPVPLEVGMIVSNEPGYYAENEYGIRCENLQVVVLADSEGYLQFETLTLLPFDQRLIDVDLLTVTEKAWLDAYHERVNSALQPLVPSDCREWLTHATRALSSSH